jgi:hypothetical protein
MVAGGMLLAISADNLRPGILDSDWGDIYTVIAIALAFSPGIIAYMVANKWTPILQDESGKTISIKANKAGLINIIWYALFGCFVIVLFLEYLRANGGGPDWWPPLG